MTGPFWRLWCKLERGVRLAELLRIKYTRWVKRRAPHSTVPTCLRAPTELAGVELALLDLLRQLDSAYGDYRVFESFEPQHRSNSLFDSPMVLFNQVVQVLAGSDSHSLGKIARFLHFPHCAMPCRIGVQSDLYRCARVLHRTAEKGSGARRPRLEQDRRRSVYRSF